MQAPTRPGPGRDGPGSPCRTARCYAMATRPMFLSASLLAVVTGTSLGWHAAGRLDAAAALLALVCIALLHAGANVLNDVFDELNGADRLNTQRIHPYTGGSRVIQDGILSLEQMRGWGTLLLLSAVLPGLWLVAYGGPWVLALGLAGIALGVAYSAPPAQLAARGLGELAVAAGFGLLPVTGSAWLQSGELTAPALLLSITVGCWVANILLINEVPDAGSDAAAGKRTLVVRLGIPGAGRLYILLSLLAALCLGLAVLPGGASPWLLPGIALLPVAVLNGRALSKAGEDRNGLKRAIVRTLAIHAAGCVWLAGAVWL